MSRPGGGAFSDGFSDARHPLPTDVTSAHVGGRMRVALTVSDGRRTEDVVVDADPQARVKDLASAAAAHLGGAAAGSAIRVRHQVVPGETAIGYAGLHHGDTITLAVREPSVTLTGPPVQRREQAVRLKSGRLHVDLDEPNAGRAGGDTKSAGGVAGRARQTIAPDDGRVQFNRPPRVMPKAAPAAFTLPVPPDAPRKAHLPLAFAIVPVLLGVTLFLITRQPYMLMLAVFSPLMAVSSYLTDRRSGRASYRERYDRFVEEVGGLGARLGEAHAREAAFRHEAAPELRLVLATARQKHRRLWERRPEDTDFLQLRVGRTDLPSGIGIEQREGGEDQLRAYAQQVAGHYRTLVDVPLGLSLADAAGFGLYGDQEMVTAMGTALIAQVAGLHSPSEVVIAAALSDQHAARWDWLKWLPHAAEDLSPVEGPPLAAGRDAAAALLGQLQALVGRRSRTGFDAAPADDGPAIVLLVDEALGLRSARIAELLADPSRARVYVVWLGRSRRAVPGRCSLLIDCSSSGWLSVTDTSSGAEYPQVAAEPLHHTDAAVFARLLAPLRDEAIVRRGAEVPTRVSLVELLDDPGVEELTSRWSAFDGRLRGPIGASAEGSVLVDLRRDGPHGLIVGTTGSGKSELLRTLVAGLCLSCPPTRLSCLLIDYKGGAAFAPCAGLPHVVDVVSDLDEQVAERALISLDAEMRRREQLLADHGVDSLLALERAAPGIAPPALLIVVDEFARLREEIPDFVDGVTDIMQRGRTLGVHTLLAAQTLRNSATNAIRANTNLRIALRVADESESAEVIGVKDAAWIPSGHASKGRAFANTGHRELTELQVAYVSGASDATAGGVSVRPFTFRAGDDGVVIRAGGSVIAGSDTDLAQLARLASDTAASMGLPLPRRPWLPPLDPSIPGGTLELDTMPRRGRIAVGVIDDPERQEQPPLVLDLEQQGHAIVHGTSGAGKTTFLRTVGTALAAAAPPRAAQLYAIDAAGHGLGVLETLPHCGAVVTGDDEERVERLLAMLAAEVDRRAAIFGPEGSASLSQHNAGTSDALPRIVLLVDGYATFAQRYDTGRADGIFGYFSQLLAAGRSTGIHVVMTADRRGALTASLAAHVGARVTLRMATADDLAMFGIDPKRVKHTSLPPGRGFTDDARLVQVVLPVGVRDADRQVDGIAALARRLAERWPGQETPPIRSLPARVFAEEIGTGTGLTAVPIGLGGPAITPQAIDVSDRHFLVVGAYRTGRSTALATIATAIARAEPAADLHLLSPRRSPLEDLDIWAGMARGMDGAVAGIDTLEAIVRERGDAIGLPPLIIVVDDAGDLGDMLLYPRLEQLVRRGRDAAVRFVVSAETAVARNVTIAWLREIRKDGQGLLLCPELPIDGDLLNATLPRRAPSPFGPGRGYLVSPGRAELVQVAG